MRSPWNVFCADPDPKQAADAARELLTDTDDALLVFVAEGGEPPLEALVEALRGATANSFAGGLFPELIVGGRRAKHGLLLVRVPAVAKPVAITDFEGARPALEDLGTGLRARSTHDTLVVLVDGLAPAISALLEATYDELGDHVSYWGGGAGTSDFVRRPCLFCREHGLLDGGALLIPTALRASLGVHHGWRPLAGPLVVTKSAANVVDQLNWRPALEVYAEHVGEHLGRPVVAKDIAEVTRSYPLGLNKQDQEFVVRDPVGAGEGGSLLCVGDVPQNASLTILHGEPATLIEAAGAAAREAAASVPAGAEVRHCLIADCISRVMFLDAGFQAEIDAIHAGLGAHAESRSSFGILTLGEISSRGDGYLEFFNKTCVVAVLHDH